MRERSGPGSAASFSSGVWIPWFVSWKKMSLSASHSTRPGSKLVSAL